MRLSLAEHRRTIKTFSLPNTVLALLLIFVLVNVSLAEFSASLKRELEFPINKKSCSGAAGFIRDSCRCITRVRKEIETECCCIGSNITKFPSNLTQNLRELVLFNTNIQRIEEEDFRKYDSLEELEITIANSLVHIDADALKNQTLLRKVTIKHAPLLKKIEGTFMENNTKFQWLTIKHTGLEELPAMRMSEGHTKEAEIDLSYNQIRSIPTGRIENLRARTLKVSKNKLERVEALAFSGSSIHNLELDDNPGLSFLSPYAFQNISVLNNVNISKTAITSLPSEGMNNVILLVIRDVPTLKELPPVTSFEKLQRAMFTYPHHCCLFKHVSKQDLHNSGIKTRFCKTKLDQDRRARIKQNRSTREVDEFGDHANWTTMLNAMWTEMTDSNTTVFDWDDFDEDEQPHDCIDPNLRDCALSFEDHELGATKCDDVEEKILLQFERVHCDPQPDAMNPCENIVGYPPLRYMIWIIWTMSVLFNAIVWVMLAMAYESRLRSHYIFMFNLSFANALSAIYLGFLAVQDQISADEYFRFAVNWQTGMGCSAAGFLCVFSSLLSILSMFFIAFEIAYSTRQAVYGRHLPFSVTIGCVIFSYTFSAVMAALPLFGISSYSTTSTCLPLFAGGIWDRVYIIFGLSVIVVAFLGMAACYGSIFKILVDPRTPSRPEDTHLIFKMLLLIVTDFICWMPSAVIGLAAAFGHPLISISVAKIFIVCFFPVNTFTNPFLYVFLTKVIQRKVKKKAIPMIRRLAQSSHALNSLSNLYHPHAPGEKGRQEKRKSEESNKLLLLQPPSNQTTTQSTQSTWLTHYTPRGSAESSALLDERLFLQPEEGERRRSTPRVSFQSDISSCSDLLTVSANPLDPASPRPKSPFRLSGILKKITAIPEVSDLSEHSSDSHHEHEITKPSVLPRTHKITNVHKCEHNDTAVHDSGRSSLASIFAKSEDRNSFSNSSCQLSIDSKQSLKIKENGHCNGQSRPLFT